MSELSFTIRDVAGLLGLTPIRDTGSDITAVCPYCGDKRGKFDMSVYKNGSRKDVFHCYNCGASGNMLKLYGDHTGKNFYDSGERIQIISEIQQRLGYHYTPVSIPEATPSKPDDELDRVYRAFLIECGELKRNHLADLNKRGLVDVSYFRSVPSNPEVICQALRQQGIELSGIPGFYLKDGYWTFSAYPGYFCPCFNQNGQIIGFQIRSDKPLKGRKYIWFSSTGKEGGTSIKARPTFLGDINSKDVIVTEGVLKAFVYHALTNATIIGIPGVNNQKELGGYLKSMPNLLKVYEAFDMDKLAYPKCDECHREDCKGKYYGLCKRKIIQTENIQKEQKALIERVEALGYNVTSLYWDRGEYWNGHYKGIDDFILAKKKGEI